MIESFQHLRPETLVRLAEFLENGGAPVAAWEGGVIRRALRTADGDADDAAALLYVAAGR